MAEDQDDFYARLAQTIDDLQEQEIGYIQRILERRGRAASATLCMGFSTLIRACL